MIEDYEFLKLLNKIDMNKIFSEEEQSYFTSYIDKVTTELETIKNYINNYNYDNKILKEKLIRLEKELKELYG